MTRIACCQTHPTVGDLAANVDAITTQLSAATGAGADIVVLPELATSGYMLEDRAEAQSTALTTNSKVFDQWAAVLGDSVAVVGFCELGDDGSLFNSAALLDSTGLRTIYRKTHLWDREKLIFTPGSSLPTVTVTEHGRLAIMVCYDLEFAEVSRSVAVRGAEIIIAPVNWPLAPRPEAEHPGELITAMSVARTNKIAVAVCDRTGTERGQLWTTGTSIINPEGWIVASVGASVGMAVADIDLSTTHDKSLTNFADALADRRLDLY
ncbi:nitrilase-related carbon-nitrogen hydrolase [Rhodococcus sp. NPDC060176]|uniref:nitrilase-related carbon-nitrogen hydrolase n=1 Tax=Rhodococcus sp. NPDC060176 TaxID=3347062 RepID=UPI00364BB1A9